MLKSTAMESEGRFRLAIRAARVTTRAAVRANLGAGRTEAALGSVERGLQLLDDLADRVHLYDGVRASYEEARTELLELRNSLSESPDQAEHR